MADQDRWRSDPNADRETAWHGEDRYPPDEPGRRYGAGDYERSRGWSDDQRRLAEQDRWRPYDPGHDSPAWRDRSGLRWSGEAGSSPRYEGRTDDWRGWEFRGHGDGPEGDLRGDLPRGREERSFLDRARDEVSSWFGDRGAEVRRRADGEHRGRGPKGYRRADARISDDIHDRLTEDSWLDASDIEVSVQGGEVTLNGRVRTREDRRRAENLAESVSGVGHVQNNLRADDPTGSTSYQPPSDSYRF